jgi:ATP-binding cassette, subfamily B, bacterial
MASGGGIRHHSSDAEQDDPKKGGAAALSKEAKNTATASQMLPSQPIFNDDQRDDEDDHLLDSDDDENEPVTFTVSETVGASSTVFRFIKPHLAVHKIGLALIGMGLLVETAFNVLMPLSVKYLIDEVLENEVLESADKSTFVTVLAVLGIAGLITSIIAVWYERKDADVTASIMADIRRRMFQHVQKMTTGYFARTRAGEIMSRFSSDVTTLESSVARAVSWAVLPLLELLTGLALLFFLSWHLALLVLMIFPIMLIGPKIVAPRAVDASYNLKRAQASELAVVHEQTAAHAVVRAFSLQPIGQRWFGQRNEQVRQAMSRANFLGAMVERSVTISVLALHLLVFGIGAWLTFDGQISLGTFVTFENVFWEISYNVAHVMQFIPMLINSAGAVRHIDEVLSQPVERGDQPGTPQLPRLSEWIRFEEVSFGYAEDELQIEDFSLDVAAGKHVAIIGPSGAGKSTLINLILRLNEPRSGRITIDGIDISAVSSESVRNQMAVVFQDSILFGTTIRENIRLGRLDATDEEVAVAAKAAEIHGFIKRLPLGYDTLVGERGATLSGGQRQRVAIARAVVRDPKILLLDEPTSALDQTTEAAILKTLRRVGRGRTMIFVTHRLTTVADFDEIVVLNEGRMVQRGPHAELVAKSGLYRQLWRNQERSSS